ncbi:MAG TPA: glycine--tRNA ligase subunit beta, partial [Burkholderiaceae bacterium]
MSNLLVELFVEELPPKALKKLGEAFANVIADSLMVQGLADQATTVTTFASPRRLGVHLTNVSERAADRQVRQKLMPVVVALDSAGQATQALLKKLASLGADASVVASLVRAPDGKAEALFWDSVQPGVSLRDGLQRALDESLARLPIPKVMTYQLADGWSDVKFVRPAHSLIALHGSEIVPVQVLGLTSGRETRGHRFEAAVERLLIESADSYDAQLKKDGAVIASFAERRAEIVRQLSAAAAGLQPIEDEALLDEVTALVERPHVVACRFEPEFLAVPQECLILTMKANQKYFPLLDAAGKLTERFLVVSNISPADAGAVIGGNERVVRPRLADAKFFFDQDRKKSLADRVPGLAKVVYHGKLGTQGERVERVRAIAKAIATQLGVDAAQVDQAAHLAKADLLTDMVGEFPELQGIMGGYYARHDGLGEQVAEAIEDHYKPRFAGDALPRNDVGVVVALADKLETLVGLFGIGQLPTGDKDPFALRRHALGLIRMLSEKAPTLELGGLLSAAVPAFGALIQDPREALSAFIFDRLSGSLREQGYSAQEVDAVMTLAPQRLADVTARLAAVRAFAALPESPSLAAANKRISNILKKSEAPVQARVDAALLREPAEQALAAALAAAQPKADARFLAGDYTASLRELAVLKAPVDAFFDGVMVNAED